MMKTNCPYCGKTVETNFEVAIGQHVICPWCERKFSFGEPRKSPARIEVPKINDGDEQIQSLNPETEYTLGFNSRNHKKFASEDGVPLTPCVYAFRTK